MQFLRPYAHVQYVNGAEQGALYDLQKGRVRTVPLVLGQVLENFQHAPLTEVLENCFGGNQAVFQRYLRFLLEEEWAFLTKEPTHFPSTDLSWDSPFSLSTAIVAHAPDSPYDLAATLAELSALGCRHLELQLHNYPWADRQHNCFKQIISTFKQCEFRRGTLVQSKDEGAKWVKVGDVDHQLQYWARFGTVVLLGQKADDNFEAQGRKYHLRTVTSLADYARKTWAQHPDTHFVGPTYFRESLVANPYFNRRLAIDRNGNFKNDLLHGGPKTFGKAGKRSIASLLEDTDFTRLWRAKPDTIQEIKNDPLRYCLRYDRPLVANATAAGNWSFASA